LDTIDYQKRLKLTAATVLAIGVLLGYLAAIEKVSTLAGAQVKKAAPLVEGERLTGEPGSSASTTTIDGKYLPPPPPNFGGEINLNACQSTPYWSPRVVPPEEAPNVLLIMTDNVGFGTPSTFGGVIPTPALERIAKGGLRYTNFHSTALC